MSEITHINKGPKPKTKDRTFEKAAVYSLLNDVPNVLPCPTCQKIWGVMLAIRAIRAKNLADHRCLTWLNFGRFSWNLSVFIEGS